jgi:hypothetical protein
MIREWHDVVAAMYCSELYICKMHNLIQIPRAPVNVESYMAVSVSIFWVIKSKWGETGSSFHGNEEN